MATLSGLMKDWGVNPSQWSQADLRKQADDITQDWGRMTGRAETLHGESLADMFSGQAARGALHSGATQRKSDIMERNLEWGLGDINLTTQRNLQDLQAQSRQQEATGGGATPKGAMPAPAGIYQPQGVTEKIVSRMDTGGGGHYLLGEQGGVFAYGGAPFYGSMFSEGLSQHLLPNQQFKSITPSPGGGYILTDANDHTYQIDAGTLAALRR